MPLPTDFHFTQKNLQDYLACPRLFELRYILNQAWPALESEPVLERERHSRLGNQFHQMLRQHFTGIPDDLILSQADQDAQLLDWWRSFTDFSPVPSEQCTFLAEHTLSATLEGNRLTAKFDLVAITPEGRHLIFDWKTGQKRTGKSILLNRIQTRLYPLLLALAMRNSAGDPLSAEQVSMIYWFANAPKNIERLDYSTHQFQLDKAFIFTLIQQIRNMPPATFILTENEKLCSFCVYRSLCNRGAEAGSWADDLETDGDEDGSLKLDFEQIAEIEY